MANKTFNSEKVIQKQVCDKCNQTIKVIRVMDKGKNKLGKQCECGLFVGNTKID